MTGGANCCRRTGWWGDVGGGYDAVAEARSKWQEPFQLCYEASAEYGAPYERLLPLAANVSVELKLLFQSKKKHNRADAQ